MKKKGLMIIALAALLLLTMACFSFGSKSEESSDGTVMEEDTSIADPTTAPAEDMSSEDSTAEEPEESMAEEPAAANEAAVTSGACYNEYFPIVEDRVLVYETDATDIEDWDTQYELSYHDVTNDSFTTAMRFYGVDETGSENEDEIFEAEIRWNCSEEGILQEDSSAFIISALEESVDIEFETLEYEGITLPLEDDFEIGSTWNTHYVITMTTTVEGMSVSSKVTLDQVNTAVAVEPVSVPYADFEESVRVETATEMTITTGTDESNAYTFTTTQDLVSWYVKGIGMVKQEDSAEGYTSTQVLVDIR